MKRRELVAVTGVSVTASVAGCIGGDSEDSAAVECPPADADEAAELVSSIAGDDFEPEDDPEPMELVHTIDEQPSVGSSGTFSDEADNPYRISVEIWDDEEIASNRPGDVGGFDIMWRGENTVLSGWMVSQLDEVTVVAHALSDVGHEPLEVFWDAVPCVDEPDRTSWD